MTLHLHRADRADTLAGALAESLREPLADPFATEVVSVPTPGVERWLSQTLSGVLGTRADGSGDGICAGIDFCSLRRLSDRALEAQLGRGDDDPWRRRRLVWPLLAEIDRSLAEPWAAPLAHHLSPASGHDTRGRRYATAAHLASLYATYARQRPEMIRAWHAGRRVDAAGESLPEELAWQAELWLRLRASIDRPSPAERHQSACAALEADPALTDLPPRLAVFGATRLATDQLQVLAALAAHREVHLWVPHPSDDLWERLRPRIAHARDDQGLLLPRRLDETAGSPRHRLLSYLGRDSRELQLVLASLTDAPRDIHHPSDRAEPASVLQLLQRDLVIDRQLDPEADLPAIAAADRSVQIHASHGPDRQVELLREVLLGLLADDPTLELRDIVVMCPDIETFAPLVSASFGLGSEETDTEHPAQRLRVRLADRSLRQLNPLLATLADLLDLTEARLEASTLLELCASGPVMTRFRFSPDDLERIHQLVRRSGIRWGLDGAHRDRFAMGAFQQNTWATGLDRMLLGVAMSEDDQHFIGTTLPMDEVESSDVELIGRLAEFIDRLRTVLRRFSQPQSLPQWLAACRDALAALTAVRPDDQWQLAHAHTELADLDADAEGRDEVLLTLPDVRSLLADTFRGRPSRANFRTGTLTMCTMTPMRSVPHRVVCLLGLDDGVFPRAGAVDGDDLSAQDPRIGDRDPRSEDRQLLLDAILSAEDHLVIVHSGADPRTNAVRPPAVPLGELIDTLDLTATAADGTALSSQLITRHPLQPFDTRNFTAAGVADRGDGPFSFDPAGLAGARAAVAERQPPVDAYAGVCLPDLPATETVALADLIRFFNHPAKALLRHRAGLHLGTDDPESDEIPVEMNGLDKWGVGERLLRQRLSGVPLERARDAEWRRGTLPPRGFGNRVLTEVERKVESLVQGAADVLDLERDGQDVLAGLDDIAVTGTIPHVRGTTITTITYSSLAPKHRFTAWLELLALTATRPEVEWSALTVGNRGTATLRPLPGEVARATLQSLVELYRSGLSEPLPYAPRTSCAYAEMRVSGSDVRRRFRELQDVWKREYDESFAAFFGPVENLGTLRTPPSRSAENLGGLTAPTRFGALACRIWEPLLTSEVLRS
ncbi:MAG: exodeoxyribonuclease V subunit gamma [Propionibacteriaceae bacterium]